MKFYAERSNQYFWEIDRFHLFTESEKCSFLEGLKEQHEVWKNIDKTDNGYTSMLVDLIKEVKESLD